MLTNNRGLTLVEVLVTGIISVIIMGATVSFITFSGRATDQINALQVLQQESSMISELFFRTVRNRNHIVAIGSGGTEIRADTIDIIGATHIRVKDQQGLFSHTDFRIRNNVLEISDSANGSFRPISTRLCIAENPSNFNIVSAGMRAQLQLTLEHTIDGTAHSYTTTLGGVRCQN